VLDALGRTVQAHTLSGIEIDLSALPDGLYTVQVFPAVGAAYTCRVVLQR
jgi:hypothetical protein